MKKELLPIGSVVQLHGATKRIMVCGRIQEEVTSGVTYDYSACYFPEGIIDPENLFLFNNTDIDMIYFIGLQDVEEFEFRTYLNEQLEKNSNDN